MTCAYNIVPMHSMCLYKAQVHTCMYLYSRPVCVRLHSRHVYYRNAYTGHTYMYMSIQQTRLCANSRGSFEYSLGNVSRKFTD